MRSRSAGMKVAAALSILGGACVLAGVFLPTGLSVVGWGLGSIAIVAAFSIALIARRKERPAKLEAKPSSL